MRTPTFNRRTANSYASHKKRAAKARIELDYTLEELRQKTEEAIEQARCYCGERITDETFSCDHAEPVSRGGSFSICNVDIVCSKCNRAKGVLRDNEFLDLMSLVSDWSPIPRNDLLKRLRAAGGMFR